jgi:hypothetical protein
MLRGDGMAGTEGSPAAEALRLRCGEDSFALIA